MVGRQLAIGGTLTSSDYVALCHHNRNMVDSTEGLLRRKRS